MMRYPAILALAAVVLASPALGANDFGLSKRDANAPVQISADRFDADFNAKTGVYSGNVVVVQGDFHLRSDKMRVNIVNGKPEKIFAYGNVVFAAPNGNAQGDNGVYDVAPRLITLTGRVILNKEKNVMRGTMLTVNLATGQAQLGAKGAQGGRVQAILTPPPQSNSAQKPNP